MSVFGRVVLAGMISASVAGFGVARAAAPGEGGDTRGRLMHASKCVMTLGFSGGCDKDQADAQGAKPSAKIPDAGPAPAKSADDGGTRGRLFHASRCVVSFGFSRGCDKDQADAPAAGHPAEAASAAPDASTRGRLFHASRCVATLGLAGDCEKGDTH